MNIWILLTITCYTLAWIPQILKTWNTKSVGDLSLGSLLLPFTGSLCGMVYAYQIHNASLASGYFLGSICTGMMIIFYFLYEK